MRTSPPSHNFGAGALSRDRAGRGCEHLRKRQSVLPDGPRMSRVPWNFGHPLFSLPILFAAGLLPQQLNLSGQPWDFISGIDINTVGLIIVGVFLMIWIGAVVYYRVGKIDERYAIAVEQNTAHEPAGG